MSKSKEGHVLYDMWMSLGDCLLSASWNGPDHYGQPLAWIRLGVHDPPRHLCWYGRPWAPERPGDWLHGFYLAASDCAVDFAAAQYQDDHHGPRTLGSTQSEADIFAGCGPTWTWRRSTWTSANAGSPPRSICGPRCWWGLFWPLHSKNILQLCAEH